ncbi:MAG: DUF4368 domain-containing protein [Ruminococcaceae bacterium]|nr:DUF4368 domain-containing protein [Oscillospiraceae bacterium]
MKQPYNTALYMRLSRDDENYGDSVSIETQRTILRQFAKDNQLHVMDEYIDDGWSGTNFERPNFKRMMDDVELGKINCIVTKDLSRFGREHVMMDYYLEFVFPEKKVRYIAVSDNEDTEKGLSDFVPFKNLFNEWFAKDTSRKVKTALHAKFAAGQHICTYAPIGYKKHSEVKNLLEIDEETRWIVEKIFDLAYRGAGAAKITNILIDEQIPTAGWLNYTRYGKFAHIYAEAPEEKRYAWTISQVKCILKDEIYIGNSVHGKQTNISYKNKKKIRKPQEEWFRVENTHAAIISKDVFQQVQEQIASRRRKQQDGTTQIFAGLVKCADCGWAMSFGTNKQNSKPYSYFNCTSYRQFGKKHATCTAHYIRYDTLYTYVHARLMYWWQQAQADEAKLTERILKAGDKENDAQTKARTASLTRAEKRKEELDRLFSKLYEDWASERITEYNFNTLSKKYQTEQEELLVKIEKLTAELSAEQQSVIDAEKWIASIKKCARPTELTADLLNSLIEKIVIHEGKDNQNGMKAQPIEIYYRFIGKID